MISPLRLLVSVLLAIAGFAGCNVVFSLDDYAGAGAKSCSHCAGSRCACEPVPPDAFDFARLARAPVFGQTCPDGMVAGQALGSGQRDTGCACRCDSPATGTPCGLVAYGQIACGGDPQATIQSSSGCAPLPSAGQPSARVMAPSGSCAPSAERNPPEFDVPFLACLDQKPASDPACDSGSLCTTSAQGPFDPAACVMAKSELESTCPSGYPHGYTFATGFDDLRSCDDTSCSCKPQVCSGSEVSLCLDSACGNCPKKAGEPDGGQPLTGCFDFGGLTHAKVDVPGVTTGACQPTGQSTSSGTLSASGTLLVCCRNALGKGP
jgi:hypothetical protein